MSLVSAFAPLNYIGCIAATISSALSDFVSCPALLEVIAADKLYPYWMVGFWGEKYGPSKQPYRAFAFTFVLALAFVLIGKSKNHLNPLNHLNPIFLKINCLFSSTGHDSFANFGFLPRHIRSYELFNISRQFDQTNRMATNVQGIDKEAYNAQVSII